MLTLLHHISVLQAIKQGSSQYNKVILNDEITMNCNNTEDHCYKFVCKELPNVDIIDVFQ